MNDKKDSNVLKKIVGGIGVLLAIGATIIAMAYLKNKDEDSEDSIMDDEIYNDNSSEYSEESIVNDDNSYEEDEEKQSKYDDRQEYYYSEYDEEWIASDSIRTFGTHYYSEEVDEMVKCESDYDNYDQEDLDSLTEYMYNKYN